ncbi:serine hydrolase domain-containing protein [Streptococcus pseudoporcinus]|uniref:serine hydrolase domain-containing protein n=1 Tax=Streptococcus pseudoporcinus TaxID=361101 RepID=UPI0001EB3744|nr:serine hydrolase domain-containing protein [Streptococcus pseudoporcinus]EFR44908.1 beta-lactamase [Streptococcus pseudoporcinus SPIN 20026]
MMSKVTDFIQKQISEGLYPGASLALFQQGKWQEYYLGTTNGKEPVRANLAYDLASVSKVVGVGTLCIFLVNSGALELDQPLQTYYPDFSNQEVTVRQLLTHTSGLDPYIPNRNQLNAAQLKEALNHLRVTRDRSFRYTDVNFLLLGFMLETLLGNSLDQLFFNYIFKPFGMHETCFGPRAGAVPTVKGIYDGIVHDPKAKVLENHAGSAGLFSTLKDMETFLDHYMQDDFSAKLFQNYSDQKKERSLAWRLDKDYLDHTGYTGTFIMYNQKQEAAIFLTNRTFDRDERAKWIKDRDALMAVIRLAFEENR